MRAGSSRVGRPAWSESTTSTRSAAVPTSASSSFAPRRVGVDRLVLIPTATSRAGRAHREGHPAPTVSSVADTALEWRTAARRSSGCWRPSRDGRRSWWSIWQRGFLEPARQMAVPRAREIVPVIQSLAERLPRQALPVVIHRVRVLPERAGPHREPAPRHKPAPPGSPARLRPASSSCLEGTPSAETVPELRRGPVRSWCASAGTTRFAVRPSTARCEPGT